MVTRLAIWFGWVMLAVGVLGFIPAVAPNGYLLGIFEVGVVHNLIHVATGIAGLALGYSGGARVFFQVFAVVYGLVAILGLFQGDHALLGIVEHNWADAGLHIVIAVFAAWAGFLTTRPREAALVR